MASDRRLAKEASPYLQEHANDPIQWHVWNKAAFEEAIQRDVPVLLSVGYFCCHWCDVMHRETFADEECAAYLNEHFVCIKMDRQEFPQVDKIYMTFVSAVTGRGGWPLNVFLTPHRHPIYGGTYFPLRHFRLLAERITDAWSKDRNAVIDQGRDFVVLLKSVSEVRASGSNAISAPAIATVLRAIFFDLEEHFDSKWGGFSTEPKVPPHSDLNVLERVSVRTEEDLSSIPKKNGERSSEWVPKSALNMISTTLDRIARGGITDHLSGGICRYSPDGFWRVPHFEIMCYDQAQLIRTYSEHYLRTRDGKFLTIACNVAEFACMVLFDETVQGFVAGTNADSLDKEGKKREGAYYLWDATEIKDALFEFRNEDEDDESIAKDLRLVEFYFGIQIGGNISPLALDMGSLNVLCQVQSIDDCCETLEMSRNLCQDSLERSLSKLRVFREKHHTAPEKDTDIVCCWNAMMVSALCFLLPLIPDERQTVLKPSGVELCSIVTDRIDQTVHLLLDTFVSSSRVMHTKSVNGLLADYAWVVRMCLDLFEFRSHDVAHLSLARDIQGTQNELFFDEKSRSYWMTAADEISEGEEHISGIALSSSTHSVDASDSFGTRLTLIRMKDAHDDVEPSGTSISVLNLVRLGILVEDKFIKLAESISSSFLSVCVEIPKAFSQMICSLLAVYDAQRSEWNKMTVIARPDFDCSGIVREIRRGTPFLPHGTLIVVKEDRVAEFFVEQFPELRDWKSLIIDDPFVVLMCRQQQCTEPIKSLDAILTRLSQAT